MLRIPTLNGHQRVSTQDLLQTIAAAVETGETDFHVSASGQHDIGGPLWNREGKILNFTITNPGQRVGSMCLPNTHITVEGPAPADVGWLNSGGTIVVKGDAGDTAAHCAAGGQVYIGGRAGTRSGSLMKHDPEHPAPELWILKSTGSFSFEFMGGGTAVVCGYDSQTLSSVLGERPGVGMVGGVIYFRGPAPDLPDDVELSLLTEDDIEWLDKGLEIFLNEIGQPKLKRELSFWKHWHKLSPAKSGKHASQLDVARFRAQKWIKGGIFGDVLHDDGEVAPLIANGKNRLKEPFSQNSDTCTDCKNCLKGCPQGAVRRQQNTDNFKYAINEDRCIGCGICAAVCPQGIWQMRLFQPE